MTKQRVDFVVAVPEPSAVTSTASGFAGLTNAAFGTSRDYRASYRSLGGFCGIVKAIKIEYEYNIDTPVSYLTLPGERILRHGCTYLSLNTPLCLRTTCDRIWHSLYLHSSRTKRHQDRSNWICRTRECRIWDIRRPPLLFVGNHKYCSKSCYDPGGMCDA